MNVARAAPVTPSLGQGPMPKISNGARIILRTTLRTWKPTVGLMMPVARKADPKATNGNWRRRPGINQSRKLLAMDVGTGYATTDSRDESRRRTVEDTRHTRYRGYDRVLHM